MALDAAALAQYTETGYYIVRGALSDSEIQRLERGLERNPPLDGTLDTSPTYPEPGRYTLACNSLKDPDLAFLAEHPTIVDGARTLLEDEPRLTAYVIYDRTPGGGGLPAHNDYKRWRPVGSSMNWLFAIVPFTDFDAESGPLYIAPGSHRLERIRPDRDDKVLHVDPCVRPADDQFIDPGLRRGDLLYMNMHLWHYADGNQSSEHRVGAFNKYGGASTPPATGYYPYDEEVYRALSPTSRDLLGVHSDRTLSTTRLVLTRTGRNGTEVALVTDEAGRLELPGGSVYDERAIPDWDLGNMIAPLKEHVSRRLGVEPPWVSWINDYDEGQGRCRVYGYHLNGRGFPVPYRAEWLTEAELSQAGSRLLHGYEAQALTAWLDPDVIRGKGVTQAQARVDQYAY